MVALSDETKVGNRGNRAFIKLPLWVISHGFPFPWAGYSVKVGIAAATSGQIQKPVTPAAVYAAFARFNIRFAN